MRRIQSVCAIYASVLMVCGWCRAEEKPASVTALFGALNVEVEILHEAIADKRFETHLGVTFTVGRLKGRRVVLAQTGVGKVNAAMTTTLLIEHYRPAEVIFTGIAGGINPNMHPGDIIIGEQTAQHDLMILGPDGYRNIAVLNPVNSVRNPLLIAADRRLVDLARQAATQIEFEKIITAQGERRPVVRQGTIVSGDAFIASSAKKAELRETLGADAVEMEGAAVAQVCHQLDVPCLIIRSLSDRADDGARSDVRRFRHVAAENSAMFVTKMVELLAKSESAQQIRPAPVRPSH